LKVLVLGRGGNEHAVIWKLSQSRHIDGIYCNPGNAGIAGIAECIDVNPHNAEALIDFVKYEWIDLTIVSSEEFLSKGIVDVFEREGCKVLGPNRTASRLRSGRVFSKDLMRLYRIPTPEYKVFSSFTLAEDYVRLKGAPVVVKADGHSDNKGIFSAQTVEEAVHVLKLVMKDKLLGDDGRQVIIEEGLKGDMVSFVFLTDGVTITPLGSVKKYATNDICSKTTGGFSPASVGGRSLENIVMDRAIPPLLKALISEGIAFKGIISAELLLKDDKVSIFDISCGFEYLDAQTILPRLQTDLTEILMAVMEEKLFETNVEWKMEPSACIMISAKNSQQETVISGLNEIDKDILIFHENTAFIGKDIVATGEQVLGVSALGSDVDEAKRKACDAAGKISFDGMDYEKF
jgi:phosphoribosylamine---glycine ligase